jgi:hypothetical protein
MASQKFGIDRRIISRWCQTIRDYNLSGISKDKRKKFRFKSKKDRAKYVAMENELFKWLVSKRELGACISGFALQQMAIEIFLKVYANTLETLLGLTMFVRRAILNV